MSDTTEVCANELLLRNTIIQKMVMGWNMAESFRLPETVPGSERIGRDPVATPTEVVADEPSPMTDASVPVDTQTAVAVDQDTLPKNTNDTNVVTEIELTGSPPVSQNN